MDKYTISEYGLIGKDKSVLSQNKFLSSVVSDRAYREIEEFAKSSGSEVFSFHSSGKYIQAKSYVGVIETSRGYKVEIIPKTTNNESIEESKRVFMALLHMLISLPSYKQFDDVQLEKIKNIDIFEVFISMFLQEVSKLIKKGVKSDYVDKEENLHYLKGKLIMSQQLKQNSIHKERFFVDYSDYSPNRAENRLIKTTLKLLLNYSKDYNNIRDIRLHLEHLSGVEFSLNIDKDLKSIKNNRGMQHYKNSLLWAKVFLKKESFSSFSGETIAFAILYPMEKLFEGFVKWWLQKRYPKLSIESQYGGRGFVDNLFSVRPDIVVLNSDKIVAIADAKWKLIEKDSNFSQNDFYQLFAYSKIFGTKKVRLYYPSSQYLKYPKTYRYFDKVVLKVIPLDIKESIKKGKL
jgi:5-methylcytosine-specific restriction enzyme subunit McrC